MAATKKTRLPECPYCRNPNLFSKPTTALGGSTLFKIFRGNKNWIYHKVKDPTAPPAYVVIRGHKFIDQWRLVVNKRNLTKRFENFILEYIGYEFGEGTKRSQLNELVPAPPPPFFIVPVPTDRAKTEDTLHPNQFSPYLLFTGCLLTHKFSDAAVEAHWWPTHGRIIKAVDPLPTERLNEDLNVIRESLEFFRAETRGGLHITDEKIRRAVRILGRNATQSAVAEELGVTARALRLWMLRSGHRFHTWEDVRKEYSVEE